MIHDRPYRAARSVEVALDEIGRLAGVQFDPELARLFVEIVERESDNVLMPGRQALEALRAAV
jgi:HD-GYP domain-containing protein (c-di-GMP phosphodiesterase class II)